MMNVSKKDVINFLKIIGNIHGNMLLFLIYCLDFIIITSPKTIFKITELKNLCYAIRPFYTWMYSWKGILVILVVVGIWMWVLWKTGKPAVEFPMYFFLFYYLLYGWSFFLNLYILSGNKNIIVNETTKIFVALLAILFLILSISDKYKEYIGMKNS